MAAQDAPDGGWIYGIDHRERQKREKQHGSTGGEKYSQ